MSRIPVIAGNTESHLRHLRPYDLLYPQRLGLARWSRYRHCLIKVISSKLDHDRKIRTYVASRHLDNHNDVHWRGGPTLRINTRDIEGGANGIDLAASIGASVISNED